ncbi:hypothetical protein UFOVP181_241 [uncultured Caudovirales phage]|uniref:Uncharacterized protein n=1 Tax=uncultured Caudovirales phage TaxID=2100421 RepID=A0A6J7WL37_9CAUD|nr:hypothetical protein UFOVP57_398 [uncultured Caudovirales phage]CAB5208908.1 hypothetical protein UFOVP181_241 [uncultured Caudovirales phage]
MTKQIINIGRTANDRSGDPLRTAFEKVNANFTELYSVDTLSKYHLGDDVQFVDIDATSGTVVIQSGFDTAMPVYIKGGNCSNGGVGGNVIIEAGGAPLPNTGTTGNVEIAAQQTTIDSNNNVWLFRDDGILELPISGDIVDSNGNTVLGGAVATGEYTFDNYGITWTNSDTPPDPIGGWFAGATISVDKLVGTIISNGIAGLQNTLNWTFGADGNLTFPQGSSFGSPGAGEFSLFNPIDTDFAIYTNNSTNHSWLFGANGTLTLPAGGDIVDSTGETVLGFAASYYSGYTVLLSYQDGHITVTGDVTNTFSSGQIIKFYTLTEDEFTIGTVTYDSGNDWTSITLVEGLGGPVDNDPIFFEKYNISEIYPGEGIQPTLTNNVLTLSALPQRLLNNGHQVVLDADGNLTLPTGGEIKTAAGIGDVVIEANDGTARTWTFGGDGVLVLPSITGDIKRNGVSVLGAALSLQAVPSTKYGQPGDTKGMIAIDSTSGDFYYCTTNYTNGLTSIWRKATGSDAW